MFIISLNYKCSLATVDQFLSDHRDFLQKQYEKGYFIVSGPKKPRTGGIIIAQAEDEASLKALLKDDPFWQHDLANYEIIEFEPSAYMPGFEALIPAIDKL